MAAKIGIKIGKCPLWGKVKIFNREINIEHKQIPNIYFNRR